MGIPGTNRKGLEIAAALGAQIARPELSLNLFCATTEEITAAAEAMVDAGRVIVTEQKGQGKMFIEACLRTENGHEAIVRMTDTHDRFSCMMLDGDVVQTNSHAVHAGIPDASPNYTLADAIAYAQTASEQSLLFFQPIVEQQWAIAEHGLHNAYGLCVGMQLRDAPVPVDERVYATCAAVDARMAGCMLPVYALAGSGNNGLTATVPIIALSKQRNEETVRMYRALALSGLITLLIKAQLGPLSSLCGCGVASAIGSCAGMSWLYGATKAQIQYAINLMVADASGMICDGAKPGCSLKIATALTSACRAAYLATLPDTTATPLYGITQMDAAKSLKNLCQLENEGMPHASELILQLMNSDSIGSIHIKQN